MGTSAAPAVMWFRRDLRLGDQPALLGALGALGVLGDAPRRAVLPLFVVDERLWGSCGPIRRRYLAESLRALDAQLRDHGGRLIVRRGDPADVVPAIASEIGADTVHVSADFTPFGSRRDDRVAHRLEDQGVALVRTGTPYAVAPGAVRKADATPYRVFTPFYRAWRDELVGPPAPWPPADAAWVEVRSNALPEGDDTTAAWPPVGEDAALERWHAFRSGPLASYGAERDRPDLAATSQLSADLKWGAIHPRTLLAELDDSAGAEVFARELAWREFYADVLHHAPASAWAPLREDVGRIEVDSGQTADQRFAAWTQGRTGYPFVDAGMRQLLVEGWIHNRVRMVVASFLVKDLHLPWQRGARWFLDHLRDGDVASNQHGWQWVAGTGTDAAPYFRIFNPVAQGLKFDPEGEYVRRYVPELRALDGSAAHEPWLGPLLAPDYPERIVDHAAERDEALARLSATKAPPR